MHVQFSEHFNLSIYLINYLEVKIVSQLANMSKESGNPRKSQKSHTPLLPKKEIHSNFQALTLFVPMAIIYFARHLTVGSYIRLRRIALRRLGRVYYV